MKNLTIILFTFGFINLNAQILEKQVVGSSGFSNNSGSIKLEATLGELSVKTKTGVFILTEGYHQAIENTEVALEENNIEVEYSLYPNPSKNNINLSLKALENINASITIFNTIGQEILPKKEISGIDPKVSFDISSLPIGAYFLKVVFENEESLQISFIKN